MERVEVVGTITPVIILRTVASLETVSFRTKKRWNTRAQDVGGLSHMAMRAIRTVRKRTTDVATRCVFPVVDVEGRHGPQDHVYAQRNVPIHWWSVTRGPQQNIESRNTTKSQRKRSQPVRRFRLKILKKMFNHYPKDLFLATMGGTRAIDRFGMAEIYDREIAERLLKCGAMKILRQAWSHGAHPVSET